MTLPRFWGPGISVMAVLSISKQEASRLDVLLRGLAGSGLPTPMCGSIFKDTAK
jgi:hypothetical protein